MVYASSKSSRYAISEVSSPAWLAAIERIIETFWVGALWAVGYLAAPVLFAGLDNHALAGQLAGAMFTRVGWLSLLAAAMLLVLQWRRGDLQRWRTGLIVAMLALIVIGEYWLRPQMASAMPADFGRLHGIAQGVYLVVSLLGLVLIAAPRR